MAKKIFSISVANKKIDDWVCRYEKQLIPTTKDYYSRLIELLYPVAVSVRATLLRQYQHGKIDYKPIEQMDENWYDIKALHKAVYYGICALNKILPF